MYFMFLIMFDRNIKINSYTLKMRKYKFQKLVMI